MFKIMEFARMAVGGKAIATLSTGYLNALEFAKTRVQGSDLTQMTNKTAPKVTILHHPDVRRSLLMQKCYAEGLRAVYLYTAAHQDDVVAELVSGADATLPVASTTCCCRSSRASGRSGRISTCRNRFRPWVVRAI